MYLFDIRIYTQIHNQHPTHNYNQPQSPLQTNTIFLSFIKTQSFLSILLSSSICWLWVYYTHHHTLHTLHALYTTTIHCATCPLVLLTLSFYLHQTKPKTKVTLLFSLLFRVLFVCTIDCTVYASAMYVHMHTSHTHIQETTIDHTYFLSALQSWVGNEPNKTKQVKEEQCDRCR